MCVCSIGSFIVDVMTNSIIIFHLRLVYKYYLMLKCSTVGNHYKTRLNSINAVTITYAFFVITNSADIHSYILLTAMPPLTFADFDGDDMINKQDLKKVINRLTGFQNLEKTDMDQLINNASVNIITDLSFSGSVDVHIL